jgi:anti-anti-sigma factor
MKITVEQAATEVVVKVEGRIDTYTTEEFEKVLMQTIDEADAIRVDFTDVEFISSAGLRTLLNGQKQVDEEDKEMVIYNINEIVESVFTSTGFMNVLEIE